MINAHPHKKRAATATLPEMSLEISTLRQSVFDRLCELIRTRSGSPPASIPRAPLDDEICALPFKEFGDHLEIAVTSTDETNIADDTVSQIEIYLSGTNVLRPISVFHTFSPFATLSIG